MAASGGTRPRALSVMSAPCFIRRHSARETQYIRVLTLHVGGVCTVIHQSGVRFFILRQDSRRHGSLLGKNRLHFESLLMGCAYMNHLRSARLLLLIVISSAASPALAMWIVDVRCAVSVKYDFEDLVQRRLQ